MRWVEISIDSIILRFPRDKVKMKTIACLGKRWGGNSISVFKGKQQGTHACLEFSIIFSESAARAKNRTKINN